MATETIQREEREIAAATAQIEVGAVAAEATLSPLGRSWSSNTTVAAQVPLRSIMGNSSTDRRVETDANSWAKVPIGARLQVLRRARHELATRSSEIASAIPPQLARTPADTLVSELLPLLEAMRFLERRAPKLLCVRRLGRRGLPFWLAGVDAEVQRVPFGRILVIGPSNYALFLPGVQVMQALAAGNTVIWKPGVGGETVAHLVARVLAQSGLPADVLQVTQDTVEAAQAAIASGVDKVFFTGSAATGKLLLRQLADTATPCVAELSGNDAVVVLPSADLDRVVAALAFGMRLNGSATCMAPRRVLLVDGPADRRTIFLDRLGAALARIDPINLPPTVRRRLVSLLTDAIGAGAILVGEPLPVDDQSAALKPLLLLNAKPHMQIAQADIFAPVLAVIDVRGRAGVLEAQAACPFALTTSIFGDEREARLLAGEITCGTVVINDLIVPTADPRVPFGGRRQSGFGVTRGAEGLHEMTAVKVVSARRGHSTRHYESTGERHAKLFAGILTAAHAGSIRQRWSGLQRAFTAARNWKKT